jgi:hypothetical protein
MWKNILEPGRPQMTICRMRIACWQTQAPSRHSEYVIIIVFTLKQWSQERIAVLRCTCIARLVDQNQVVSEERGGCGRRPRSLTSYTVTIFWNESYRRTFHVPNLICVPNAKSCLVDAAVQPVTSSGIRKETFLSGSWEKKKTASISDNVTESFYFLNFFNNKWN